MRGAITIIMNYFGWECWSAGGSEGSTEGWIDEPRSAMWEAQQSQVLGSALESQQP